LQVLNHHVSFIYPSCNSDDLSVEKISKGIPLTGFAVEDIQKEYERMKKLGVVFTMEPTQTGTANVAVFDDTCGNLIQLYQEATAKKTDSETA